VRAAKSSAAAILAVTLTLAGVGCGSEAAAPAYAAQWEAVNPDGTFWFFSWWDPLGGGSVPDLADGGTHALTAGTEMAGTLTLHQTHQYDFGLGAWTAVPFDRTIVYTLDTTVTPGCPAERRHGLPLRGPPGRGPAGAVAETGAALRSGPRWV